MPPSKCRLVVYVDETVPGRVEQVKRILALAVRWSLLNILGVGYAFHYFNVFAAGTVELVRPLEKRLNDLEGVYANCFRQSWRHGLDSTSRANHLGAKRKSA